MSTQKPTTPAPPRVPAYPNIDATMGAVLPVVTTLLATVSAATVIVPLAGDDAAGKLDIGRVAVTTGNAGLILGTLATLALVGATLSLAYAHAKNLDALPAERQDQIFADAGVAEAARGAHRAAYRKDRDRWYVRGQVQWLVGVELYLLCLARIVQ